MLLCVFRTDAHHTTPLSPHRVSDMSDASKRTKQRPSGQLQPSQIPGRVSAHTERGKGAALEIPPFSPKGVQPEPIANPIHSAENSPKTGGGRRLTGNAGGTGGNGGTGCYIENSDSDSSNDEVRYHYHQHQRRTRRRTRRDTRHHTRRCRPCRPRRPRRPRRPLGPHRQRHQRPRERHHYCMHHGPTSK